MAKKRARKTLFEPTQPQSATNHALGGPLHSKNARRRELLLGEQHCKDERGNAARAHVTKRAFNHVAARNTRWRKSIQGGKNAQRKSSGVETSLDTDKTKLWGRSGVSMRARRRTKINMPPELSCTPSMPRVSSGFTRVLFRQGLRPSARHSAGSKSRPRDAAANAREAPSIGETGQ